MYFSNERIWALQIAISHIAYYNIDMYIQKNSKNTAKVSS